ncbi:MAG: protein serine/threonine phosphatase [Bacteroidetes bacterium]|nr:protein serine/threonine phosphatase [Bacteroidota bacterium]
MLNFKLYSLVFFIFLKLGSFASGGSDSLYKLLKSKLNDTTLIDIYNELCWPVYSFSNTDSALKYGDKAIRLSTKINDQKRLAIACRRMGIAYINRADHQQALFYQNKSYDICKSIGYKKGMASALNNISVIYLNISDLKKAIDYSLRSQKLQEEIKDSTILFESYYNTGLLFKGINDYEKALIYYRKAFKVASLEKQNAKMGFALSGIGTVVKQKQKYDSAQYFYETAFNYFEKERNIQGVTEILTNLGSLFIERKDIPVNVAAKASLKYYFKALEALEAYDNNLIKSNVLGNVADSYFRLKKYDSAEYYGKKTIELATLSNNQGELVFIYSILSATYEKIGDYKQSLYYLNKHNALKDIVYNDDKQKEILQKQLQFDFDKKLLADSLQQVEEKKISSTKIELANSKLKQEKYLVYSLIIGIVFIITFMFFLYNRFRAIKEKNFIIEEQKHQVTQQKEIIEEKQKEIVASLKYAKRIQKTLLVKDNELTQYLKEHFVLFKPKDIVSGDFYWTAKKDGLFFVACCDCTGHGVPGAFMSLLSIGFLTEAINEKNILEPNKIFDHVRKRLIESISQDGGQDGMDGILLCIDSGSGSITYAAANNAPVLVKEKSITHLPADKMPVGLGVRNENFKLYSFNKNDADTIYLYTDGYADQFGGGKGKKFKYKQLDELLLSLSSTPPDEQAQTLEQRFEEWKGNLEQVDDVCVIGIKL